MKPQRYLKWKLIFGFNGLSLAAGMSSNPDIQKCLSAPATNPNMIARLGFSRQLCERKFSTENGIPPILVGLYCMIAGLAIGAYEQYKGFIREGKTPLRSWGYLFACIPGFFTCT